ncbi:MAG: DUF2974 domain-containing protein [Lachnospiraceae bacterium]|nr:DUF2974 domain-containing protein [Lachnospiraceae bacterium]
MAFTDVEMAILSQLSYREFAADNSEKKTLYSFLDENLDVLKDELGEGYHTAIENLMDKVEGEDYIIIHSVEDSHDTGFAAMAIKDPNDVVTVACRGTESFRIWKEESRKDVFEDISLALPTETNQQRELQLFMKEVQAKGDFEGYYFTGHSLGGNLAVYGATMLVDSKLLRGCRTYNAPGFNSVFMTENADKFFFVEDRIINYQNEKDGVSGSFMNPPGKTIVLECRGWDLAHPIGIDAHGIDHFMIGEDGGFQRNTTGFKQSTIVGELLDGVTQLSDIVVFLGNVLINGWDSVKETVRRLVNQKYVSAHSYIKVDTDTLRTYAARIAEVNRRINIADKKMDKLYWSVGLFDLWNLVKADAMTSENWKLNRCQTYLLETATDFENAEYVISTQ